MFVACFVCVCVCVCTSLTSVTLCFFTFSSGVYAHHGVGVFGRAGQRPAGDPGGARELPGPETPHAGRRSRPAQPTLCVEKCTSWCLRPFPSLFPCPFHAHLLPALSVIDAGLLGVRIELRLWRKRGLWRRWQWRRAIGSDWCWCRCWSCFLRFQNPRQSPRKLTGCHASSCCC